MLGRPILPPLGSLWSSYLLFVKQVESSAESLIVILQGKSCKIIKISLPSPPPPGCSLCLVPEEEGDGAAAAPPGQNQKCALQRLPGPIFPFFKGLFPFTQKLNSNRPPWYSAQAPSAPLPGLRKGIACPKAHLLSLPTTQLV